MNKWHIWAREEPCFTWRSCGLGVASRGSMLFPWLRRKLWTWAGRVGWWPSWEAAGPKGSHRLKDMQIAMILGDLWKGADGWQSQNTLWVTTVTCRSQYHTALMPPTKEYQPPCRGCADGYLDGLILPRLVPSPEEGVGNSDENTNLNETESVLPINGCMNWPQSSFSGGRSVAPFFLTQASDCRI